MMPTFPRSPLSFRTACFPQYGWKAGFPSGACLWRWLSLQTSIATWSVRYFISYLMRRHLFENDNDFFGHDVDRLQPIDSIEQSL